MCLINQFEQIIDLITGKKRLASRVPQNIIEYTSFFYLHLLHTQVNHNKYPAAV